MYKINGLFFAITSPRVKKMKSVTPPALCLSCKMTMNSLLFGRTAVRWYMWKINKFVLPVCTSFARLFVS